MRIHVARVLCVAALAACGSSSTEPSGDGGGQPAGCGSASLLANPADFAAHGPWAVGARTATLGGLTLEVWYPAVPGSDAGQMTARYDIREQLPASEAAKIPDADNPWQSCDCVRDLPLDTEHGPYPLVVFVHGTASFRHQSLSIVTHWASRGFVVVAVDHPGLKLGDTLAQACGGSPPAQHISEDIDAEIAAVGAASGDLAFLAGHVDLGRIAVAGHSAGANAAVGAASKPGVQVVIPMAGNQATTAGASLYLGGTADQIVSWGQTMTAFGGAVTPKRLVGIANGGHLTFSDLCTTKNAAGQDLLQVASAHMVCGAQLAGFLFDCDPSHIDGPTGWSIINDATSAVLESTLQCNAHASLAGLMERHSGVATVEEDL
jgi:alpha-beta hydrolase superfamily lysophospholipase